MNFGPNNVFKDLDILRTSGEGGLIFYDGTSAIENIILDNIRVGTLAARPKSDVANRLLHLGSPNDSSPKSLTIRNSSFPSNFNGTLIGAGWSITFTNVTIGGDKLVGDQQIGLTEIGAGSSVVYN